jgi:hypothetical protein
MSINRRNFLKNGSLYAGGLLHYTDLFKLISAVAATTVQKAHAEVTGYNPKGYLNIHLSGGPARFQFDQWLTPNINDANLSSADPTYWNAGVATAINNNNPEYRLYTYRGVRVPHHMQYPVITSKGNVSLDTLLDHWGVIRGYNSGTDGHEVNNPIQTYPDPAAPSLHGLSADYRKDLISAVDFSGRMPFGSMAGKVASMVASHGTASGSVGGLMNVFKKYVATSSVITNIDQLAQARTYFRDMMKASLGQYDKTTANAIKDHISSGDLLIQHASENLDTVWSTLYNKYRTTIQKSAQIVDGPNGAIPFLTDNPIKLVAGDALTSDDFPNGIDSNFDLREMINSGNTNLSTDVNLARMLALYEYCMTRGITGVQGGQTGTTMGNLRYKKPDASTYTTLNMGHDQHNVLHKINTLVSAAFYRGLMGGILELIDFLKTTQVNGKDLFSQSVIHVTGDFTRSPRNDKVGYDHGWNAQATSVFSGAIQGPIIMGNIKKAGQSGYNGTWGIADATDFNGTKEVLSPRHVGAAMATLIGVPNPWSFTHKVWDLQNGVIVPKVAAKIVG